MELCNSSRVQHHLELLKMILNVKL